MDKSYANVELYQVLGLEFGADEKQVAKAYKKKSLQHHPDRGGDVAKFLELKHARDVLLDPKKKTEYDRKVSQEILARKKQRERDAELDTKRRQMRNELLRKEQDAECQRQRKTPTFAWNNQRNELNRMREQAQAKQREMEEQLASLQQVRRQAQARRDEQRDLDFATRKSQRTVTFKWNRRLVSHSDETIAKVVRPYGDVESIKVKSSGAKVVFQSETAAAQAVRMEGHKPEWRHVSLKGHLVDVKDTVWGPGPTTTTHGNSNATSNQEAHREVYLPTGPIALDNHLEFETLVLNKLRRVAAIQQQKAHTPVAAAQ